MYQYWFISCEECKILIIGKMSVKYMGILYYLCNFTLNLKLSWESENKAYAMRTRGTQEREGQARSIQVLTGAVSGALGKKFSFYLGSNNLGAADGQFLF